MRQHQDPDPDDYKDEEELEELGTPLYQGSGLSVRALTAEELQRFLDAHHDQPARSSSPRPACPTAGWSAWWSPRWWPGGCGSAPPSR
jgi:hypothetical protein